MPRVADCPIAISYDMLLLVDSLRPSDSVADSRFNDHRSYLRDVLDLKHGSVSDDERTEVLFALARQLADIARNVEDIDGLRSLYVQGMFRRGYTHGIAREMFGRSPVAGQPIELDSSG